MGTCYYGLCHDCRQRIDLDKFHMFAACRQIQDVGALAASFDREGCGGSKDVFVERCLRLFTFMNAHRGHRLQVASEHEHDGDGWETVMAAPGGPDRGTLTFDWTDPASPCRLVLKTAFGDVTIDNRGSDVNCFRVIRGKRVDTLIVGKEPPRGP